MAKLFQALEGLGDGIEKVASGLGDGLQKVADKTESITNRINRHVNPLSSHYGEGSRGGPWGYDAHSERRESSDRASDPNFSGAAGSAAGSYPHMRGRQQSSGDLGVRVSTDVSAGLSRSAFQVTQTILNAVEGEIQELHREKEGYLATLASIRKLEAEQEEEYKKLEEELRGKEAHLLCAISEAENQQALTTVQF